MMFLLPNYYWGDGKNLQNQNNSELKCKTAIYLQVFDFKSFFIIHVIIVDGFKKIKYAKTWKTFQKLI